MAISDRKKRETEALRQQVLDTAEDIIVREGLQQVTMRRIAAGVDYAPTVLYRLFDGKTDLIDHLIARGYKDVRQRYAKAQANKGLSSLETLEHILHQYIAYALDHPNHYHMWFETGTLQVTGETLKMTHDRLDFDVFQPWLDAIATCQKESLFPNTTPITVFTTLWPKVHGLISLRLQNPTFPWPPQTQHLTQVLALHTQAKDTSS